MPWTTSAPATPRSHYLHQLPISILKIDQGFVADIERSESGLAIVTAITTLGHALGLTVITEGVETQAQHSKFDELRCELAQGYYYARPMPGERIPDHLRKDLRSKTSTLDRPDS